MAHDRPEPGQGSGPGDGRTDDGHASDDAPSAEETAEAEDIAKRDAIKGSPDASEGGHHAHLPHGVKTHGRALVFAVGHEELIIRRRYEAASICNDILIALWFLVGSVLFFSQALMTPGTWCFVVGSVELLIRPLIRLSRHFHLQRFRPPGSTVPRETAEDY